MGKKEEAEEINLEEIDEYLDSLNLERKQNLKISDDVPLSQIDLDEIDNYLNELAKKTPKNWNPDNPIMLSFGFIWSYLMLISKFFCQSWIFSNIIYSKGQMFLIIKKIQNSQTFPFQ